jgi:uncharacterized integral membrane protein
MTDFNNQKNTSNKNLLIQYAALGTQLLAGLIIAVFAGRWVDKKANFTFPVFIWLFPLIVIVGMILKAVKDTSKKEK